MWWLAYLSLGKMAAISQTTFSKALSWMKGFDFNLTSILKGPIDNKSALV